ncbi:uncharacterized protein EV420DRAFT_702442 [Desarmillaria tabescens]|uniref:Protein kinase domain-containing protein n=1 Tax=Armillaria tabescens TaxID=1929756 RepID=A0AA39JZW6_ARMTA|nr:uncharacterized protein EV420DRAFT_702442 [Desarmillaria tabescens]KAK0452002.1 hypothetical protein EV420DRAFT_702442 [Desarmillaria tabescens]
MSPITSSTSTKHRSALSGDDALKDLFAHRPTFTKRPGFRGSRDTRGPAHYDMHLHPQLILKDIVYFRDMLDQLSKVVDTKIQDFTSNSPTKSLPRVSAASVLHKANVSTEVQTSGTWVVGHEADLQKAYPRLEQYPTLVASTLVAGLDDWSSIFRYDEKPRVASTCALADGYLSLDKAAIKTTDLPVKDKLQLVIEQDLSDFLFWEYKSMNAGSMGVMLAIHHLTGSQFSWVSCPRSKSCDNQFCHKKDNRFKFTVTGFKTGVDGVILEDRPNGGNGGKKDAGLDFAFDKSRIDCSLIASVPDTRRWKFKGSESPKKRVRPESDVGNQHLNDDDDDGDEGHAGDDDVDNNDSSDSPVAVEDTLLFTQGEYSTALKVIQQIWAEAVNIDATFMVLNCGSLEYIGIRDRKLQRLYLSPLLDLGNPAPDSPGYFKIHTGLNIVAISDAIKRAEKLKALKAIRRLPKLYTFKYDRSEIYEDKAPKKTKRSRPSISTKTPRAAVKATTFADRDKESGKDLNIWELDFSPAEIQLFRRLRGAQSLKITWRQDISGLGSASSIRMTRPTWPAYIDTWTEEMEVLVMSQCPKSKHTYSCYVDDGQTAVRGIVVKFALGRHEKAGLRNEYDMYARFPSIEGIVKDLGIVEQFGLYQHTGDRKMALVLLDGGDPVTKFGPGRIPAGIYSQVQEAVKKMHSAMVTHGDLIPENILITKDPKEKSRWQIHLINWKNGRDHRTSTAVQRAYNAYVLSTLTRCSQRLKRCMEPVRIPHKVTDVSSKERAARKRRPRRSMFGVVPKAKITSVVKENLRRRRKAVTMDLKRLQDPVWHK